MFLLMLLWSGGKCCERDGVSSDYFCWLFVAFSGFIGGHGV